jgi:hypothetical protein
MTPGRPAKNQQEGTMSVAADAIRIEKLQPSLGVRISGIDLNSEQYVLDMLKSNPKVECERSGDNNDELSFRYRTKFAIANKLELINEIRRVDNGLAACDITNPPCYPGIENDISKS